MVEDFLVGLLIAGHAIRRRLEKGSAKSTGWPDEAARRWRKLIQSRDSPFHVPGDQDLAGWENGEWVSAPP